MPKTRNQNSPRRSSTHKHTCAHEVYFDFDFILSSGIYASGILSGGDSYNHGAVPKDKVEMVRRWKELADL